MVRLVSDPVAQDQGHYGDGLFPLTPVVGGFEAVDPGKRFRVHRHEVLHLASILATP